MPKYLVNHSERVSYESVIVDAPDMEAAETIVRDMDVRDLDPNGQEGDNYTLDVSEADAEDLRTFRHLELDGSGDALPFKQAHDQASYSYSELAFIQDKAREVLDLIDGGASSLTREDLEGIVNDIIQGAYHEGRLNA